jgi:hypothetical protein
MKTTVVWPDIPPPPPAKIVIEFDQASALSLKSFIRKAFKNEGKDQWLDGEERIVATLLNNQLDEAMSQIRQHFFPREKP